MREETLLLRLNKYEEGAVLTALNDLRNKFILENRATDIVDDILLKIIDAPTRKAKVRNEAR